jgi:hypothetical protein
MKNKVYDLSLLEVENQDRNDLLEAFDMIQMPRTPYALKHLVVGTRFTPEQQYHQCVLEMQIAYDNLRIALLKAELKQLDIYALDNDDPRQAIRKKIKQVELEQINRTILGAKREFGALYAIWQSFPERYTRAQIDKAQEAEYRMKLSAQAQMDINTMGQVGQGNQEGLREIGVFPVVNGIQYPELPHGRLRKAEIEEKTE